MTQLFQKYNVPGPRYTSYPTVPYWEESPTPQFWLESIVHALDTAQARGTGAALYIHIPFCESLCTYCGCNTRITRNHGVGNPYVDTVLKEFAIYYQGYTKDKPHSDVAPKIPLSEIHLGGGTPTFLSPSELTRLIQGILAFCEIREDSEFSLEADPRVTSREHLVALQELGFKRMSFGIQDFDPKVQETVHRVQSFEQVKALTEMSRELGFTSVNYDLIYGLPFQTTQSIQDTLDKVSILRPDRIAFYAYAHVPWIKPGQRRFTEADLPAGPEKRALYELGRTLLEKAGYLEVGMDHFALATDSLWKAVENGKLHRNFMGYTARPVHPLIGLGVSAIGDSWNAFAQNEKLLETYQARVAKGELPIHRGHILSSEDLSLRQHILNLMTQFHTAWDETDIQEGFMESAQAKLSELERDGLVELNAMGCKVTLKGRPFLRNVSMAFDARLSRKSPGTQLFSQTI
jgi:oxygen-independent coproporphyrinogen-3 oxidase